MALFKPLLQIVYIRLISVKYSSSVCQSVYQCCIWINFMDLINVGHDGIHFNTLQEFYLIFI